MVAVTEEMVAVVAVAPAAVVAAAASAATARSLQKHSSRMLHGHQSCPVAQGAQNSSAIVVPEHASLSLFGQEAHSVRPSPRSVRSCCRSVVDRPTRRCRRWVVAYDDVDDDETCDARKNKPPNAALKIMVVGRKQVLARLRFRVLFGIR